MNWKLCRRMVVKYLTVLHSSTHSTSYHSSHQYQSIYDFWCTFLEFWNAFRMPNIITSKYMIRWINLNKKYLFQHFDLSCFIDLFAADLGSGNLIIFIYFAFTALGGFLFTLKCGTKPLNIAIKYYALLAVSFYIESACNNYVLGLDISTPVFFFWFFDRY